MFQKEIIPEKMLTYIGENHIMLEMIVVGVLLLLMVSVSLKVSRMRKDVRGICKQVRRYLDVVLSEDSENGILEDETEEEMQPEAVDLQQIHTYQRKKEEEPPRQNQRPGEDLQSQRDAELLMEVIQDVF
ncbi:MAG: hypothetical protein NC307_08815 [Roseburia sp.]|nr:hypothetical protein [Roseburia sp.]